LHGEVALVAEFLDLVHLGLEPVDVILFVLQENDQQISRAVILFRDGDLDGGVIGLDGGKLQVEVALDHFLDILADGQLQRLHAGDAFEKENALDQRFGVLHFADGLFLDVFGKAVVAPVFTHFRVEKVLIDGGQLFAESFVEFGDDFW
jgi:hypothetical protein